MSGNGDSTISTCDIHCYCPSIYKVCKHNQGMAVPRTSEQEKEKEMRMNTMTKTTRAVALYKKLNMFIYSNEPFQNAFTTHHPIPATPIVQG